MIFTLSLTLIGPMFYLCTWIYTKPKGIVCLPSALGTRLAAHYLRRHLHTLNAFVHCIPDLCMEQTNSRDTNSGISFSLTRLFSEQTESKGETVPLLLNSSGNAPTRATRSQARPATGRDHPLRKSRCLSVTCHLHSTYTLPARPARCERKARGR